MERKFRLFLKNLPPNANDAKVKELLGQYVTLHDIDIKEKKDAQDNVNKFAFINVTTTDQDLNNCKYT